MMSVLLVFSVVVSFLLSLLFLLTFWRKQKKYKFLPPGPAPLPLLGTPKYMGEHAACKYFPELSRKYGPVFTVWKLTNPIVVICGYEAVKDALLQHAEEFSGRPISAIAKLYDKGFCFPSIDGERWRQLRRFTMSALRNVGMGKTSMERQILEESKHLIKAVTQMGGKPFNPMEVLGYAVGNIMSCALLGERFNYNDPKLQELFETSRRFSMKTHSYLYEEKISKEVCELAAFTKIYIDNHKRSLNPNAPRHFIDYFLIKIKEEESHSGSNFSENSLIMSLIALLPTGIETTSITLNFALNLISNYPDVQVKVQQEIDEVTGSQRPPEYMDRAQMPYTNAVIHEMQRVLDLAPVAHYHAVTKDTQFRGYTLPKGITVIPFLSSVLSDPTQWETPEDFNPGHFLDDKGQFRPRPAFMAFSAGKRVCAGETMARMQIFLLLCALLQKFSFTLPPGTERQDCRKLKQNKVQAMFFSQICAKPRPGSSTA
ncbi:cytochrome P450 2C8-like isoform X2 [Engystomops pustulosus]|uniref:cytochrome P450 2C8-like isoform X2 n=1 Tax=Engystomops pustulosus TaxID=76066 RepID=UPI003AFAE542